MLGLADSHETDQKQVYEEFKEQLGRSDPGWYETKLPWKGERGSKRRLDQLIRKLGKNGQYAEYNEIIQDPLQQGVIEIAPTEPTGKEYYIPPPPPQGCNKENAESTKLRVVYDASGLPSPRTTPPEWLMGYPGQIKVLSNPSYW